jgi:hypothetical protein
MARNNFRLRLSAMLLLLAAPAFLTLAFVNSFGVNLPVVDDWDFAETLVRFKEHSLTLKDLWAQHNEHRILFPRMLMLAMANFTHWNLRAEMFLSVLLASISVVLLALLIHKSFGGWNKYSVALAAIGSALFFSLSQWQNWLWGFQIAWFLPPLCLLGTLLAQRSGLAWLGRLVISLLLMFISTFSMANGMICWVVTLPAIARALKAESLRPKRMAWVIWAVAFVSTMAAYFYGYNHPSHHPSLVLALQHPGANVRFFLTWLGSAVGSFLVSPYSEFHLPVSTLMILGAGALVFLGVSLTLLGACSCEACSWERLDVPLALIGFSVVSGLVITLGRSGLGHEMALESRYITYSSLFFVGLSWLAADLVSKKMIGWGGRLYRIGSVAGLTALAGGLLLSNRDGWRRGPDLCRAHLNLKAEIQLSRILPVQEDLARIRWRNDFPRLVATLVQYHLMVPGLVISDLLTNEQMITPPIQVPAGHLDTFVAQKDQRYFLAGWAVIPQQNRVADAVLFVCSEDGAKWRIFNLAQKLHQPRLDVVTGTRNRAFERSGWSAEIKLPGYPSSTKVMVLAFDANQQKYYRVSVPIALHEATGAQVR